MENKNYLDIFKSFPHCGLDYKVVDDWGYTPNLYHFRGEWHVDWISSDEDILFGFEGNTPEEAIENARRGTKIIDGYILVHESL